MIISRSISSGLAPDQVVFTVILGFSTVGTSWIGILLSETTPKIRQKKY